MRIQLDYRYSLLTVAYLLVIYWLSSLPDLGPPDDPRMLLVLNLGHIPLFAGLAFCLLKSVSRVGEFRGARYGLAFAVSGACGALDEWHQSFVPGRHCSMGDFLLDLAGVGAMLIMLRLIALRKQRRPVGHIAHLDSPVMCTQPPAFPASSEVSVAGRGK